MKPRVGLLSPFFTSSPVYFLSIGALRLLTEAADLVFFHRSGQSDWATNAFRKIASEWVDCAYLSSADLRQRIVQQQLDVLVDMGGWSDVAGLQAIATKPAPRMYKWIGGQSATTGITAFDGWITDRHQSLPKHQAHHSEPLLYFDGGYVTYTPPAYMPAPVSAPANELLLGVVSNPAKLSNHFFTQLPNHLKQARKTDLPFRLQFIDRRFAHGEVKDRVLLALGKTWHKHAEFVVPNSHLEYLGAVGRLSAVIDSCPYSAGLTAMEAISLGVPILTKPGALFSERHAYAHLAYEWPGLGRIKIADLPALGGQLRRLHEQTAVRRDHRRLAESLKSLVLQTA